MASTQKNMPLQAIFINELGEFLIPSQKMAINTELRVRIIYRGQYSPGLIFVLQ